MLTVENTLLKNVHLATRELLKINQEIALHLFFDGGLPQEQGQPFIKNSANEAEWLGLRRKSQV